MNDALNESTGAGTTGATAGSAADLGFGPRHREPDSRRKARHRSWLREWGPFIAIPVIMLLLRMFVFGVYVIPSGSMKDTLLINDRVMTSKL